MDILLRYKRVQNESKRNRIALSTHMVAYVNVTHFAVHYTHPNTVVYVCFREGRMQILPLQK